MDESANTPELIPPPGAADGHDATPPAPRSPGPAQGGVIDHEAADDGPQPHLDVDVEQQLRALLAAAPDPGPMPDAVSGRISSALLEESRLRVRPGPLAPARSGSDPAGTGDGTVLPMPSRADRPKPLYIVAAVAAAAVVVAVGASALHVTKRPNGAAVVGDPFGSGATTATTATTSSAPAAPGGLHIQLSTTAYTAGNLATEARSLLDHPGDPIRDLAAESPGIGPIATPIGLASCLEEIGALQAADPAPDAVSADLATFDGRPAVVVVVTRGSASTAWAVERSCTTGAPGLLQGATPVP